jgi:hypothetical protein
MTAGNDNVPPALRAGIEAAEAAMLGLDDDDELVSNLAYIVALALDHRLDKPGYGIPELVARLISRIGESATSILEDWNIGKSAGLKRLRQFVVACDSGGQR